MTSATGTSEAHQLPPPCGEGDSAPAERGGGSRCGHTHTPTPPRFARVAFPAGGRELGFTLVELTVAMLIIGMASAALMLSLPAPGGDVRRQADRLAAHAAAARDLAISCGCPVRLATDVAGWQVLRQSQTGWLPDPTMKPAALPAGMALPVSNVDFDATGLATPARLLINGSDSAAAVTIDAAGGVRAGAA